MKTILEQLQELRNACESNEKVDWCDSDANHEFAQIRQGLQKLIEQIHR